MAIELQFVGSSALASRLIEWKGAGRYSHVDIVLPDNMLLGARDDAIGSIPAGVQIRPPYYEDWEAIARIELINASETQEQAFYDFARKQIGKPYDHDSILGFILNRNWRDDSSWFCSELAMASVEAANIFEFPLVTPVSKVDPDMAFAILSTYGKTTIIK